MEIKLSDPSVLTALQGHTSAIFRYRVEYYNVGWCLRA